jgi:hypothetical protein
LDLDGLRIKQVRRLSFAARHNAQEIGPLAEKPLVMSDARREPRKVVIARVQLRWEDQNGATRVSTALAEDFSKNGAGIRVAEPIAAGTRLQVTGRGEVFLAEVRHCQPDGSAYLIGVRREPAS